MKLFVFIVFLGIVFPALSYSQRTVHVMDTTFLPEKGYYISDSFYCYNGDSIIYNKIVVEFYNMRRQLLAVKRINVLNRIVCESFSIYYSNGKVKEMYTIINYRKIGYYLLCYENGNINMTGNYRTELPTRPISTSKSKRIEFWEDPLLSGDIMDVKYIKEEKCGEWYYYDVNGKLVKTEMYSN